jgi:DNA-binding CsgD family transcriptional regulator
VVDIQEKLSFTPTQKKIMDILSDGHPHLETDLIKLGIDEFANPRTLKMHLSMIRKKIRPKKREIISTRLHRKLYYQLVGLLH